MKRQSFFLTVLTFCFLWNAAQDPHFNNIHQSLVQFNPSFAGSSEHWRNQTVYRNQWPNLSGSYITYNTCVDGHIDQINGGLAFSIISDDGGHGTLRRTSAAISYAQDIKLSDEIRAVPSVQVSYNQSTLDKGRLNFGDPIDMRYGIYWKNNGVIPPWGALDVPVPTRKYYNTQLGLLIKYGKYFNAGASFANVLRPDISHYGHYRLPVRTNIHLQHTGPFSRLSSMDVTALLIIQNSYFNSQLNVIHKLDRSCGLLYGAGYGLSNTYILPSGINNDVYHSLRGFLGYSKGNFGITYCYDQYIGYSASYAASHEVSLSVLFAKREKNK